MENKNQERQLPSPEINQAIQEPTVPVVEKLQQNIPKKDSKIPKVSVFILISIILLVIVAFVVLFYRKKLIKELKPTPSSIVTVTPVPSVLPTVEQTPEIETDQQGVIEGKITLNYKISEFPEINDDITLAISEKNENEANYFSAAMCEKNKDNCIWLIFQNETSRIYGYKLTFEGGTDFLRRGEKYKMYIFIRHYNDDGDITGSKSDKVSVQIPESGLKTQDFILSVYPLKIDSELNPELQ